MRSYLDATLSFFIFYSFLFQIVKLQLYTAISDLEQLMETEEIALNSLDLYLEIEEQRLKKVKQKRELFARLHEMAQTDVEQFLWNPVNAYMLIKRLTADWRETHHLIVSPYSRDVFKNAVSHIMVHPEEEDLIGAADALIRLQDFYSLGSLNVATGQNEDNTFFSELTIEDCFLLGQQAYKNKKWSQSLFWLHESMRILENKKDASVPYKIQILGHIANVHNSLQNYTAASEVSENILKLDPNHAQAIENLKFYRTREADVKNTESSTGENHQDPANLEEIPSKVDTKYRELCQGRQKKKPEEEKHLHCYFASNNNSYLLLQPIKVEVVNLNPLLLMYHDVIKDDDAESLRILAYPKLEKSPVPIRNSEKNQYSRISKSALLEDDEHPVLEKMSRRLQDITGLNSHPNVPLEVVNYGIGGHYEPHLAYEPMSEKQVATEMGYPLSSWMAYLNDVISGGSTVFTEIGVEITPIKGAVLFWHNFHRNGTGIEVTKHADCPVLIGSKWVANKWFSSHGNEFIHKCSQNQLE